MDFPQPMTKQPVDVQKSLPICMWYAGCGTMSIDL